MKKVLYLFAAVVFLSACNQAPKTAEDAKDYSWIMGLLDIDRLAKGFALLPDRGENMDDGNASHPMRF